VLSDPAMEDALYEIESMRRFAGLELNADAIPDETTILKFRRFLEHHSLAKKMLEAAHTPERRGLAAAPGNDRERHDHPSAVLEQECEQTV